MRYQFVITPAQEGLVHDDNMLPDGSVKSGVPTSAGLAARMLIPLAASAGSGILIDSFLGTAEPDPLLRAALSVLVAASVAAIALGTMLIRPLVRSRADLQVRYQAAVADASRDGLTGLGNHRAFQEELDRQVEHATRYHVPVSLVMIDLDEFKQVNDRGGHGAGDKTLAGFGKLVSAALRRVDQAFRVGGDEFALLLPHTDADGAHIVARRLLASALQPVLRDPEIRPVSFSAGISAVPALADNRSQLLTQADAALYAAKRAGRTEVAIFDPSAAPSDSAAGTSAAISEVIARNLLRPVFQPIVNLADGATIGYEGLIRPVSPAPYADPAALFAAAEASGHVVTLDLACVEAIVAAAAGIPDDLFLSVNLSPMTVEAPEFSTPAMLSILARHRFPPERLVIELTEHHPITDVDHVRTKLDSCRGAGIRLAADDLGAGNAGLRLLSDLRFDVIKVDLGLVQRSSPGARSSAVVESIVAFASRTGALVIGEGVEHEAQVQQLTDLGVTAAQGFLFSRPGPLPDFGDAPAPARKILAPAAVEAPEADASLEAWRRSIGLASPAA